MSTPQSLNHFRQYGPGAGDVLFETTKLEISQSQSQSSLDLESRSRHRQHRLV